MAINWEITHPAWSLDSIYRADDVNRLRQVFQNVNELEGESQLVELAFKSLYRTSEIGAAKCSDWLASIAVRYVAPTLDRPAIYEAAADRKISAVKFLLPHCPKDQIVGTSGALLMCACRADLDEVVEVVAPHCTVDRPANGGETALMAATTIGSAALRALLPYADRAKRDNMGFNALMHAIQHNNREALAVLLPGASRSEIKSKKAGGRSALELAESFQWAIDQGVWRPSDPQFRPVDMIEAELAQRAAKQIREAATVRGQAKRKTGATANDRRGLGR